MRLRPTAPEGWFSAFLLILMILCLSGSIEFAGWAEQLYLLQSVALLAPIAGVLLANSRLPDFVAHFVSGLLGVTWIGYLGTSLFPRTPEWGQRLAKLVVHVVLWAQTAWQGGKSADNLVFVLEMAFLIWVVGHTAAWLVFRRHNALVAVATIGAFLLVNTYYSPHDGTGFLLIYLLLGFLLVIRRNFTQQEQKWKKGQVQYNPDLSFYFVRDGLFLALIVIAAAWFAPATPSDPRLTPLTARLSGPWHQMQQHWNRLFSSLHYGKGHAGNTYFGTTLAFSGPVNLTDRVVLKVRSDDGRYWRGAVYDKYTSAGWVNTDNVLLDMGKSTAQLPIIPYQKRRAVFQTYQLVEPHGNLLFAASQPAQVSLDTQALVMPLSSRKTGGKTEVAAADIAMLYSAESLYRGEQYQVRSYISHADVQSLRHAGTIYPTWVRKNYLSLPDTLPNRVREEAATVVQGLTNPYDKAHALETYLRAFKYNEAIPPPPTGHDGVDYFLFERREGYCDYYASAMAVMLRSTGVPARVVSGYAQGQYDSRSHTFVVQERDAHTWVEVFFPRFGWIEFEPTAAEPAIHRPEAPDEGKPDAETGLRPTPEPGETTASRLDRLRDIAAFGKVPPPTGVAAALRRSANLLVRWLLITGLSAILGAGVLWLWLRKQRQRWPGVQAVFWQVQFMGQLGGIRPHPWETVREYVTTLAKGNRTLRAPLMRLADLVTHWRYGPREKQPPDAAAAEAELLWKHLRWPLIRFAFRPRRIHRPFPESWAGIWKYLLKKGGRLPRSKRR